MVFSQDYLTAKNRFIEAILRLNFDHQSYAIGQKGWEGEELTIDVGISGNKEATKVLIISSGLHGVEGFLGSAVQLKLLEKISQENFINDDIKLILIHGLNPYGWSWKRRFNEDNIDLNRNFLLVDEKYQGSPEKYGQLNYFLNPREINYKFESFLLKTIWLILRYGMTALKNSIAGGQYDFPQGLFFGGNQLAKTGEILAKNLAQWIDNGQEIIHLDFHTGGLKKKGEYKLLIEASHSSPLFQQLHSFFTNLSAIEPENKDGIGYTVRGCLSKWCQEKFSQFNYLVLTPEFGTCSSIKILQALRAENYAHWYLKKGDLAWEKAKQNLVEVFFPNDKIWRENALNQSMNLIAEAVFFLNNK